MRWNPLELAWAAGFFDGEGHVSSTPNWNRKLPLVYPKLHLSQCDPGPLERFRDALGFPVRVTGPYSGRKKNWSPQWQLIIQRFEHVQQSIILLWPYLCPPKRLQALKALQKARRFRRGIYKWEQCRNLGHDVRVSEGCKKRNIWCRTCRRATSESILHPIKKSSI